METPTTHHSSVLKIQMMWSASRGCRHLLMAFSHLGTDRVPEAMFEWFDDGFGVDNVLDHCAFFDLICGMCQDTAARKKRKTELNKLVRDWIMDILPKFPKLRTMTSLVGTEANEDVKFLLDFEGFRKFTIQFINQILKFEIPPYPLFILKGAMGSITIQHRFHKTLLQALSGEYSMTDQRIDVHLQELMKLKKEKYVQYMFGYDKRTLSIEQQMNEAKHETDELDQEIATKRRKNDIEMRREAARIGLLEGGTPVAARLALREGKPKNPVLHVSSSTTEPDIATTAPTISPAMTAARSDAYPAALPTVPAVPTTAARADA